MLLEVCLSLLISVLPVLISLIQKEIIDYLADYIPSVDKLPRVFYEYCVYMGLLLFALAIFQMAVDYINNIGGLKYRYKNMLKNVDKMSSLKMEHLENPKIHFLFDLSCQEANVNPIVIVKDIG